MASQVRESSFNLKLDLLEKGHEFSFFQALRLLRLLTGQTEKTDERKRAEEQNIKILPELSLAFPPADVAKIEEGNETHPGFTITPTFFGLYGTSSPLPVFYTEDLIEEANEDTSVTRDFIDIFHRRLYSLLFRCWTKYRQFLQVVEENNPKDAERLYCLLGLGEKELRESALEPYSLLRYIGLFTQFPRSALGLETLLQDFLRGIPVHLVPCLRRKAEIPLDQRLSLGLSGSGLGEDSFLGEEVEDRMGKFLLKIGPLDGEQFHSLLPGSLLHQKLTFLIRFYLREPWEYEMEMILIPGEVKTVSLGANEWSVLGWDTWVFSGDYPGEARATILTPNS